MSPIGKAELMRLWRLDIEASGNFSANLPTTHFYSRDSLKAAKQKATNSTQFRARVFKRLIERGWNGQGIANFWSVTRSRVHQILQAAT